MQLWSDAGHSEIKTTMQAWAEGWKLMDQNRLEPLLDNSYTGIFEETKPAILRFASKHHGEEKTSVRLALDKMEIKVKGRTATVRNIHCTGQLEPGWTIDLVIDYSLQKDGDVWRITQATWNRDALNKKEEKKAKELADSKA